MLNVPKSSEGEGYTSHWFGNRSRCSKLRYKAWECIPVGHKRLVESHGSKLAAVVETLQNIKHGDSITKALIFVQWSSLKPRIESALRSEGVPICVFHGNVATRDATITRF